MIFAYLALMLIALTFSLIALRQLVFRFRPDSALAGWLGANDAYLDQFIDGCVEDENGKRA
ncbi:MAG: hypothetical protein WBA67_06890 [Jannaschia sp.]